MGARLLFPALVTLTISACTLLPRQPTPDQAFQSYTTQFVQELMAFNPEWAVGAGAYEHAARMTVLDAGRRQAQLAFVERHLGTLDAFDPAALSPSLRAEHAMIRNHLEGTRWRQEVMRDWTWNPSLYNVARPFALLISTEYAPLEQRLRTILERLQNVPAYYRVARENIDTPTLEHTELAIEQNKGVLGVFGDDLLHVVRDSALDDEDKALFEQRLTSARAAVQYYVDWLTDLKPTLTGDKVRPFRLGETLYEPLFAYTIQSGYSASELYQRAVQERDRLHLEMERIARELWPKYFPDTPEPEHSLEIIGEMIDHLSARHVAPDDFFDEIKRQIPLLEAFVREHDLLDQDPTKPLVVRETPEYMRGVAGASISAPGPFNPGADTYYNVTPLDHYTPEQAESYLREYNHWILQVLNIHEAIPGHYTQLLHANRSPSMVKSLLRNGAMIEGWAVYAERMMLEQDWGDHAPEMWLMYGKWNLRVVTNTILDYAVHVQGMDQETALDLLMRQAFQTETEARGKWRRVTLSSVQLTSYFAGYAEIYDFREQRRQEQGEDFDLKTFHNDFLSYGSAPVPVIRQLMSGD